jgi:hypothetical protein
MATDSRTVTFLFTVRKKKVRGIITGDLEYYEIGPPPGDLLKVAKREQCTALLENVSFFFFVIFLLWRSENLHHVQVTGDRICGIAVKSFWL